MLTGSIPPALGNLTNLVELMLFNNQLSGPISQELGNLTSLYALYLQNNQLTGSIPHELGALVNLWYLNLYDNRLSGQIPSELGNLTILQNLSLHNNQLDGLIPASLGNLVNLHQLFLASNKLTGEIPTSLANLVNLNSNQTNIGYNALHTTNESLINFLNSKDPDWASTQTIAPTGVTAMSLDNAVIAVSWLPVTYTGDAGYYEVWYGRDAGGPYSGIAAQTSDKATTSILVPGLTPGVRYYFIVRTFTNPHANNQNIVKSDDSMEATAVAWLQTSVHITGTIMAGGVPLPGVVMNGLTGSPVTDEFGIYTGTEPVDWSGAVTPTLAGYVFSPVSTPYSHITADQTGQDYTATLLTYTISGTVTVGSTGLAGVIMSGLPGNPVTGADGSYAATVNNGFSGTVTPTLAGYTFEPPYRTYSPVSSDQTNQNYAATAVVIPTITVTSPNGGERWAVGSTHDITWTQTGLTGSVTVDLYKGGVFWKNLGTADATAGTLSWTIVSNETARTDYRVLIWQSGGVSDDSDANFSVVRTVRVDFNKDGQEDLLWRYYGVGGYNRVWFLGTSGAATQPLTLAGSPTDSSSAPAQMPKARASRSVLSDPREIGVVSDPKANLKAEDVQAVMRVRGGRTTATATVNDPRNAGRLGTLPTTQASPASVTDPTQARLIFNAATSSGNRASIAATKTWLGGADLLTVGDLSWKVRGTGDFNGDGNVDILWRYEGPGGANVIWFMDGTDWIGSAELIPVDDLNWQIVGTGDFNKDGHMDILWRYNGDGGYNVVWYMNGAEWIGSAELITVSDLNWKIVGTGDFNKDGNVDILWRYAEGPGFVYVWYMNGTSWIGGGDLISVADQTWQIMGTGDYDNDGNVDILWRYNGAGGAVYIWYLEGVQWIGGGDLMPVGDLNWKIVSR
jgi:hypothetical protein